MILTVKIELEKNKESMQAVLTALSDFELSGVSWQDDVQYKTEASLSGKTDPGDLSAAVSAAVDRQQRNMG